MAKQKKIIQFRDGCIGCNSCTEHAPGNWEISAEDGKACLKRALGKDGIFILPISEPEIEANKMAARDCPAGIIKGLNEEGNDITWE